MRAKKTSFLQFIFSDNKNYLVAAGVLGVVYFIILRFLFPIPSFYSDSFTWIGGAKTLQPITFRPIGYSKLIFFFHFFSNSDLALIATQYISNVVINLFLFFTCAWLFHLKKGYTFLLFLLLMVNPFYLFYSNYVSSDAFFNAFTVLWFTLLIWIMHKPSGWFIFAQTLVLAGLFFLRYNAIFFPAISTIAILLSKQIWWKKTLQISLGFLTIFAIVLYTTMETKKFTGTNTFSAFSGWQLANDALHIVRHQTIDTASIDDEETKALLRYTIRYFDTTSQTFPDTAVTAFYMWHQKSPLKTYMQVYPGRKKTYFATWNVLGRVYSNFGKTIILQQPGSYIQHFVLPNTKAYFFPPLEIYEDYMEKADTLANIAVKFFHYSTTKTPAAHPKVYDAVFKPAGYLFTLITFLFIVTSAYYFTTKKYLEQSVLFNHTLLCYGAFCIANFFFIVLLAPTVLRYHIFIMTLSFPVLITMIGMKKGSKTETM